MKVPVIEAAKVLRAVGFDLRGAMEQIRCIRSFAENGTLMPGDMILMGPAGAVALSEVYAALGVEEAA